MKDCKNGLDLNIREEVDRICAFIRGQVRRLRKKGIVIGLSGGVDSSLCVELCSRAWDGDKILGLILPERESHPSSRVLAAAQAEKTGIAAEEIDITPVLEAFGTYEKRDRIVREIFPDFGAGDRMRICLPGHLLTDPRLGVYTLQVEDRAGRRRQHRLNKRELKGITAAMATKQRTRMMTLYHAAEERDFLVCGTTNRNETVLGFFVRFGDAAVDIEPIAHLYKSQVNALAESVGVIPEIIRRTPTPDTYSLETSDEEFYFRLPYDLLDWLLCAWENRLPAESAAEALDLGSALVERVYKDFEIKHRAARIFLEPPPSLGV